MDEKAGGAAGDSAKTTGCWLCEAAVPLLERAIGGETLEHFRASRIEFLKGLRSMLDARIDHLSKQSARGTKVTVE